MSRTPSSIRRFCAATSSAGDAFSSAWAAFCLRAPTTVANRAANSAATSLDRVIPLAGLSEIAWANSPFASGAASKAATACAPALSPNTVTLSGSPPKAPMLSLTQRKASTMSRRSRLLSRVTALVDGADRSRERRAPEPVVDAHIHTPAASQRPPVVDRSGRATQDVSTPVHEDHDRKRLALGGFRCNDIERQAVLAYRLVFADSEYGVSAFLGCAFGEAVAIAHTRPWFGRLGCPKSPRADRRTGVRDGSPPVHAAAGEAFDSAGGSRHADGVLVHHLTVANVKGQRSAGRVRGPGSSSWCRRPRSAPPAPDAASHREHPPHTGYRIRAPPPRRATSAHPVRSRWRPRRRTRRCNPRR